MSNLTEFIDLFLSLVNTAIGWLLFIVVLILTIIVIVIELMKNFNPEIETTEQAVRQLVEGLNGPEEEDQDPIKFSEIFTDKPPLGLLILPLLGAIVVLSVTSIFPSYNAMMLEIISKYYISVFIYIAVFVMLYTIGLQFVSTVLWFADKFVELFYSTQKIIEEEKKPDE